MRSPNSRVIEIHNRMLIFYSFLLLLCLLKEEQLFSVSLPETDRNPRPLYFIIISFLERFIVHENYQESTNMKVILS